MASPSISDLVRSDALQALPPADRRALALTIAGEVDPRQTRYGSPRASKEIASIIETVMTRAEKQGKTISEVVRQRSQYSTWNTQKDRGRAKDNYSKYSSDILRGMSDYFSGRTKPVAKGVINYFSPSGMKPKGATPGWNFDNLRFEGDVGPHKFYSPFEDFGSRNLPRSRDVALAAQKPGIGSGTATAALGPPAPSGRATSLYPGDLPASLAWDSRMYAPTLAEAWQSSARPSIPQPNIVNARSGSGFAPLGAIDPTTAMATGASPSGLSAQASATLPPFGTPLSGQMQAGVNPTVAAQAGKPIPTNDLRPFNASVDQPRLNPDGSFSTEVTRTAQTPAGTWTNIPSLWSGPGGLRDFGALSDDELAQVATNYERMSGESFPRYNAMQEAERAAVARSAAGGATRTPLARPTYDPLSSVRQAGGLTPSPARQVQTQRITLPAVGQSPIVTGADAAKWGQGYAQLAAARRPTQIATSQPSLPTVSPTVPKPPSPTDGWMDNPLGALKGAMAAAAAKAAPALQKAEQGLKTLSSPFVQALLAPGPVQQAMLAGQTGGARGFWEAFNRAGAPSHLIGQASRAAMEQFGGARPAPPSAPRPPAMFPAGGIGSDWAAGSRGNVGFGVNTSPNATWGNTDPYGNQYGSSGYGTLPF